MMRKPVCALLVVLLVDGAHAQTTCFNSCGINNVYTNDGKCDDRGPGAEYWVSGNTCPLGYDCADCGPRYTTLATLYSTRCINSCGTNNQYISDGDCDDGGYGAEFSYCSLGYDCDDCGGRAVTYCASNCWVDGVCQNGYSACVASMTIGIIFAIAVPACCCLGLCGFGAFFFWSRMQQQQQAALARARRQAGNGAAGTAMSVTTNPAPVQATATYATQESHPVQATAVATAVAVPVIATAVSTPVVATPPVARAMAV